MADSDNPNESSDAGKNGSFEVSNRSPSEGGATGLSEKLIEHNVINRIQPASTAVALRADEIPLTLRVIVDPKALQNTTALDLFDDPARVALFIEAAKLLPLTERNHVRLQLKAYARQFEDISNASDNYSNSTFLLATTFGGGLMAGGLLLLASAPVTIPLCVGTGMGTIALLGGLWIGHRLRRQKNLQIRAAKLCNDLAEEIR